VNVLTLKMYGASDDLVECEGIPGCDEFDVYDETPQFIVNHVNHMEGSLLITAVYSGAWAFAIADNSDDYDGLPPWPIRRTWGNDVPYSETIEIDVPEGTTLRKRPKQ